MCQFQQNPDLLGINQTNPLVSRTSLEVALGATAVKQQMTPELISSLGQELSPISVFLSKKQALQLYYLAALLANRRVHSAVSLPECWGHKCWSEGANLNTRAVTAFSNAKQLHFACISLCKAKLIIPKGF